MRHRNCNFEIVDAGWHRIVEMPHVCTAFFMAGLSVIASKNR
jgi:hypothetical protein